MFNFYNKTKVQENKLYNKILILSRNKLLYKKFKISDTFQNRIYLIFFHVTFLLVKLKNSKKSHLYKDFSQKVFDCVFKNIELNMREIGFGDVTVNKNMKFLTKVFYKTLPFVENYTKKTIDNKKSFLFKYINGEAINNNDGLIDYFDKYHSFCFDLSEDSVLNGDLKFNYK